MLTYGTYGRIEAAAGGVYASPRAMIRALRSKLTPEAKARHNKAKRQALINQMFEFQAAELDTVRRFRF